MFKRIATAFLAILVLMVLLNPFSSVAASSTLAITATRTATKKPAITATRTATKKPAITATRTATKKPAITVTRTPNWTATAKPTQTATRTADPNNSLYLLYVGPGDGSSGYVFEYTLFSPQDLSNKVTAYKDPRNGQWVPIIWDDCSVGWPTLPSTGWCLSYNIGSWETPEVSWESPIVFQLFPGATMPSLVSLYHRMMPSSDGFVMDNTKTLWVDSYSGKATVFNNAKVNYSTTYRALGNFSNYTGIQLDEHCQGWNTYQECTFTLLQGKHGIASTQAGYFQVRDATTGKSIPVIIKPLYVNSWGQTERWSVFYYYTPAASSNSEQQKLTVNGVEIGDIAP